MFGTLALAALLSACGGGGGGSGGGNSGGGGGVVQQPQGVQLSVASMSFLGVGPSLAQTVVASEVNYSGAFTASSTTCTGIATIALQSGSTTMFSVTPVGAGTCSFSIADTMNQSKSFTVTVTTTTVGGS
ncbi:MAG TPA: hypothetical protein VGR69_04470 [Candidatus Rubrimentiphilum sp.]|nr:hypothetical protein [Candidatus Rubrimentiphilum sp.]